MSDGEVERTDDPIIVEWKDGLDNMQNVHVDPYRGKITVNGFEYDVTELDGGAV